MNCPAGSVFTFRRGLTLQCGALRCLNCGHRLGEANLDLHHGFSVPPPPHTVILPLYDPEHRRLLYINHTWQVTNKGYELVRSSKQAA